METMRSWKSNRLLWALTTLYFRTKSISSCTEIKLHHIPLSEGMEHISDRKSSPENFLFSTSPTIKHEDEVCLKTPTGQTTHVSTTRLLEKVRTAHVEIFGAPVLLRVWFCLCDSVGRVVWAGHFKVSQGVGTYCWTIALWANFVNKCGKQHKPKNLHYIDQLVTL